MEMIQPTISDFSRSMSKYDPEKVSFKGWLSAFEKKLGLYDIEREKDKIRLLINGLPQKWELYAMQHGEDQDGRLSYEKIKEVLREKCLEEVSLEDFWDLKMERDESVDEFADRLKRMSEDLRIDEKTVIRQFRVSLKFGIRERMSAMTYSSLQEAVWSAKNVERDLNEKARYTKAFSDPSGKCNKCNGEHKGRCVRCFKCSNWGHKSEQCTTTNPDINNLEIEKINVEEYVPGFINDVAFKIMIDTGASITVINEKNFGKLKLDLESTDGTVSAGYSSIEILGTSALNVRLQNNLEFEQIFHVLEGEFPKIPIIGRDCLCGKLNAKLEVRLESVNLLETDQNREFLELLDGKLSHLSVEDKNEVIEIVCKYSVDNTKPINLPPVKFELKPNADLSALQQKPYKEQHQEEMQRIIEKGIKNGHFKHGISSVSSPAFLVKKPNNKGWRLVIDYRLLNTQLLKTGQPLPIIIDLLNSVHGSEVFSVFDLEDGFHQLGVDEATGKLLSFVTSDGMQYEFNRLGQGASPSPGIFQYNLLTILKQLKNMGLYIDDLLLHDRDMTAHKAQLRDLIGICNEYNLRINWNKAQLCKSSVVYLGFELDKHGFRPKGEYLNELHTLASPRNKKEVQRLIGMVNWIKQFVKGYEILIQPIRRLLKVDKFKWTTDAEEAFRSIITQAEKTDLKYFSSGDFDLYCDASKSGIGGSLYQNDKLVALFSKCLSDTESSWNSFEKEMMAVQYGLNKYGRFIGNQLVRVHTDNEAVGYYIQGYGNKTSPKVRRWIETILDYNVEYVKISGKDNTQADILSRMPHQSTPSINVVDLDVEDGWINNLEMVCAVETRSKRKLQELHDSDDVPNHEQSKKPRIEYSAALPVSVVEEPVREEFNDELRCVCNSKLEVDTLIQCDICDHYVHNTCYGLPENMEGMPFECEICDQHQAENQGEQPSNNQEFNDLLKYYHRTHPGINAMQILMKSIDYPNKFQLIAQYVNRCKLCKEKRIPIQSKMTLRKPNEINQIVGADVMYTDDEDYPYVLIVKECVTGFTHLEPLTSKQPEETLRGLLHYISKVGIPEQIVLDGGTEFLGAFKAFLDQEGIKCNPCTKSIHRENGLAERGIQYVQSMYRIIRQEYRELPFTTQMALCNHWINYNPKSFGYSSQQMMNLLFKSDINTSDLRQQIIGRINAKKVKIENKLNKRLRSVELEVGDSVFYYKKEGYR
eukprot:NODE_119_length_18186_cov_1.929397.p1 type:complete len:1211 gc:universal NODE_119_length_18186_cov_1.929397:63-3695(+)